MEKKRHNIKIAASEIRRLRKKVRSLTNKSDPIDDEFHQDLRSIVTETTKNSPDFSLRNFSPSLLGSTTCQCFQEKLKAVSLAPPND